MEIYVHLCMSFKRNRLRGLTARIIKLW